VPIKNLDPLRGDIEKLKTLEKADFKNTAQGRDMKWKKKVADEIEVEISEEEHKEEETENKEKREEIHERKKRMKESLSKRPFQKINNFKRNVYLTAEEMKGLSQELSQARINNLKAEVRSFSNTVTRESIINDPNLSAWQRVRARSQTPRHSRVRKPNTDETRGTFDNLKSNLVKRKPKHFKGSVNKYKRR
jgi:hypothetical protein